MILALDGGELGMFCPVHSFFYALRLAERYGASMPRLGLDDRTMRVFWERDEERALAGRLRIAARLDGARIRRAHAQRIAEALERSRDDLPRHGVEIAWDDLCPPRNVLEVFAGPMRTFVVDLAEFMHGREVRIVTFPPPDALAAI